jgi:hypothetical protein
MPVTTALIAAGGQIVGGVYQQLRAARLRKKAMERYNANPYQIPESAIRSVNLAGRAAQGTQLPGQELIEENMAANTAEGINAIRSSASSPSQILASTIELYGQQQKNQQQLDLTAAQDYQRRQGAYAEAVKSLAPFEVEKWKYRTLYPVQADLNAASGMSGAGQQNVSQGISSGINAYASGSYQDSLNTPQSNNNSHTKQYYLGQMNQPTSNTPTLNVGRSQLLPFNG